MKRIWITMTCDEGFVADTLRALATEYEYRTEPGEYWFDHGTAQIEEYQEEE